MPMWCMCGVIQAISEVVSCQTLCISTVFIAISGIVLILLLRATTTPYPMIIIHTKERYFHDPWENERQPLPQLGTLLASKDQITYADLAPSTLYLSVIVPAYNEQDRLGVMLNESVEFLEQYNKRYEIIVVDDGSKDRTTEVAMSFVRKYGAQKIRVITLLHNRGKGGAIRIGILAARGELCLFADADGATKFEDFVKLEQWILQQQARVGKPKVGDNQFDACQHPIAIGSRAHLENESIAKRSLFRTILMYGFHTVVWLLTVRTVRDTQCGFKLLPRPIAHILFTHLHVERWAFDVELLVLAEHLQLPIGEIPVRWTEIEGSKLVPFFSWLQMGKDVVLIFARYASGAHQYPQPPFVQVHSLNGARKVK